ncbi:MAG TPA: GNAT family N-acetyltransferase, partial [Jatrophihabitans sp.]|nr:GNAT family N-acetyltransferase [Jatrophihabitans sp.]
MDIEIRQATPEDYREISRVDGISFGYSPTEQEYDDVFGVDPPRYQVAVQDGRIIGTAGEHPFEMTVPGGRQVSVPGVTWVSVLPTHRRRGVLRALMQQLLVGYHEHGYPAAVLTASEGSIYRRFGFGPSTQSVKITIDRTKAALLHPVDTAEVRYLSAAEAREPIMELHRRWRLQTPGALNRTDTWWDYLFRDREAHREGMSEKFYLVHPDGYLAYRVAEVWTDGLPASRCSLVDYRPVTPTAHAALWQVLLGLDLVTSIESWEVPLDDPLPFLLDNPRQIRIVASKDGMWLRPVEVCALLAARTYSVDVEAVLDVDGERVLLTGGPSGADCVPT